MAQRDLLEANLSREELLALRNKRTGLTIFQLSWILVFVCLVVVNLQLRSNYPSWPPPGVEPLSIFPPTLATVLLIVSAVLARQSMQAVNTGNISTFRSLWKAVLILGAVFVAIIAYEWIIIPSSGQYGTLFRVMTAYHAVHALAIGIYMWQIYRTHITPNVTNNTEIGDWWLFEAGVKLWYFVVVAWILFYVVLYWI
ncbi:MAG: heme-copper oxidase subunit III [Burkholderiales bacterium]|nr:heme-copper oxidase subunit III [Anaerolineae bacterium]